MVVLVTVVLDFLEDKVGQSLAILLELVCIFINECPFSCYANIDIKKESACIFFLCRCRTGAHLTRCQIW